ncbi:TatD family hydrolase [Aridibaculum aurantiacum]|uniref:TatD family hydrolase n=1 Tax=Aridibaculum aurantiacum TaxID=2810307 RepID=UPI001A96B8B8|nr:TatD family hydrolase [Aridibaculum aurantiacum]
MRLVDTHTHLYLKEFENDIHQVIETARHEGVQQFYLPAIDSAVLDAMLALEVKYPGVCIPMIGLHPCSVKENFKQELELIDEWLQKRKFVAIGETGLDFYWDKTFVAQQYEAFNWQMEKALEYKLPIVIHTRNAMQETIDAVKPFAARGLKGIFHCFGESKEFAQQVIEMNFLLGIGGVLTYKKAGLADVLKDISLDHIVLETDAPFLTPVPFRGKRNQSSYIKIIAEKLAEVKQVSLEEVAAITSANADIIFNAASTS